MSFEKALEMLVSKLSGWFQQFVLVLPNLAIAVIIVMVFLLLAKLAKNLSLQLLGRVSPTEEVNRLLGALIFLSLFTVGVFMALGIVGLDKTVTSLLAGAGILALAVGFAFQDIASNFIAGVFLSIRRPFQTGHLIETNHFLGTVERISLRSTELRTPQGQLVLIPNKEVPKWIDSSKHDFAQARSEAIEWIKRVFDENGITLPYPIQTLAAQAAGSS